ncbi:MAG: type II toxin-antitoxin system prevent-host-death family antitoxin [Spirochaetales bacterium]|jgi:prevent-host-death family protein|nr:type II toxin-antitoxin system prevent-host-death family antitoxin [Spirochaetales bacterium]
MKQANISTTKNNFSKLIDEVRGGEVIVILDRDVPVAQLQPINSLEDFSVRIPALARDGIVSIPAAQLDTQKFLEREKPRLKKGSSAVKAVLDERVEGR